MIRQLPLLAALFLAAPAFADPEPPYYGPAKPWGGISFAFKFGYEEKLEKDGSWKITAGVRRGEALDMAMYRAAEKARDGGYRYVQFLRGVAGRMPGMGTATVWVRPVGTADAPIGCKVAKAGGCYTADVAQVLRVLGGPGGTQPGVAIVDHLDKYGRPVQLSGFGIGATDGRGTILSRTIDGRVEIRQTGAFSPAAAAMPASRPAAPAYKPPPVVAAMTPVAAKPASYASAAPAYTAAEEAQARYDAALRSQRGTRGRRAGSAATISD